MLFGGTPRVGCPLAIETRKEIMMTRQRETIEILDYVERQRLRNKMLDRWENEGGRIAEQSMLVHQIEREHQAPTSNEDLSDH